MALNDKKMFKIYEKRDASDKHYVSDAKQSAISSSYARAEHLNDEAIFEFTAPLIYQMQLIEEEIDELRRTTTSSAETRIFTQVTSSIISASGNIIGDNIKGESLNIGSAFSVSSGGSITTLNNLNAGNSSIYDTHNIKGKTTLDGNITSSGDISGSSTSNIIIGGNFIGNNIGPIYDDYIYLTPTDFDHLTDKSAILVAGEIENNGGYLADNNARGSYHAQKIIPKGYKATHVMVEGSAASDNYAVYSSSYDVGTAAIVGSATNVGTEKAITSVTGGGGTYVSILWGSRGNTDVYGGYIKIVKV